LFGDDVVAAAMIGRLVHPTDVVGLWGECYRLKDREPRRVCTEAASTDARCSGDNARR
jgi:hypothetical protein